MESYKKTNESSLFDIEHATDKQFRHYRYTVLTFLSLLLSSKQFLNHVSITLQLIKMAKKLNIRYNNDINFKELCFLFIYIDIIFFFFFSLEIGYSTHECTQTHTDTYTHKEYIFPLEVPLLRRGLPPPTHFLPVCR